MEVSQTIDKANLNKPSTSVIWSSTRQQVSFNLSLVCGITILAGISCTVLWNNLDRWVQIVLCSSIALSFFYISMFVLKVRWTKQGILLRLPQFNVQRSFDEIQSVILNQKWGKEYLILRTKKRIGTRRTFSFLIKNNEAEMVELLNLLFQNRVKTFVNPEIEAPIQLDKKNGRFELKQ